MGKLTPAQVSYLHECVILYCIYMMMGHFISRLFQGSLHVDKIHVRFKITNITQEIPILVHQQTDFTLKQVVVLRLHDTIVKFRTRV